MFPVDPNAVEPVGVVMPPGRSRRAGHRQAGVDVVVRRSRPAQFRHSPSAMIGLAILVVLILIALLAPLIAP